VFDETGSRTRKGVGERVEMLLKRAQQPLNDLGNARRLKAAYGDNIINIVSRGWAVWNGSKYDLAQGEIEAAKLAATLGELVAEEAQAIRELDRTKHTFDRSEHPFPDDLIRFSNRCGNMSMRRHALEALKTECAVSIDQLDLAPELFTVTNGCIDLDAFANSPGFPAQRKRNASAMGVWANAFFGAHLREHRPTRAANVTYDPTATCPNFKAMLRTVFPDDDVRSCFQRCAGAMLFGRNNSQAMLLFRGSGGNGKSTLLNVFSKVLGDYAVPCPIEVFLKTATQHAGRATPEEMNMPSARMVYASEPGMTDTLSGKAIKGFTGGDARMARALHQNPFKYTPTAIPVLQFNRTPRIVEEDEGLRRRLVFIPFDVELHKLPEKQRKDPRKVEAALQDELSGILNWMLAGYKKYAERLDKGKGAPPGIDPPPMMLALRDRLLRQADPVGEFLADVTRSDIGKRLDLKELYTRFIDWADCNGTAHVKSWTFQRLLTEKGYETRKSNGYSKVLDLSWR
jgi:P4 family phage/plasmid primase-like protien